MYNYRPVSERINDYQPVELRLPPEMLEKELQRCQDCGVPFCHASGCPLGNAIPEINAKARSGRWTAALGNLLSTSPFPEFTGRVCPGLCEGACVQGLAEAAVPCRQVELEVIERGFTEGLVRPNPPARRLNFSAAVVGSGPAGLAAAWRLNQAGLQVTVFEKDARPGGFLRYGLPDFKLDKGVLDRRLAILKREGIDFQCRVEAGLDLSPRLLRLRHDFLVLAGGARSQRDLIRPGRDLAGIHPAINYLAAQNRVVSGELDRLPAEFNSQGRRVVVIGGGDTGSDCVGTAWRQGAREVTQIEILPQPPLARSEDNPWPQWPRLLKNTSSHEEGGRRLWNIDTLEFLRSAREPGRVGGLVVREVAWTLENGRPVRPEPVAGSEFRLEADLVLLALGFTGIEDSPLWSALNLKPTREGTLPRDPAGHLAPESGAGNGPDGHRPDRSLLPVNTYACGDAALGPSLVVRAIADGLAVAETLIQDNLRP